MYFAISKITFEQETTSYDHKELKSLIEKLRARFKITIRISEDFQKTGEPSIILAALHPQQEALSKLLDSVVEFCELSGFGRIADEKTILEDLDSALEESY
ncbi:MAG: hypothetical protein ACOH5I_22945 [Oligoflexus sp.]